MGAHQDPVQRGIVLGVAVVSTGLNSAFDALIGMVIHIVFLLIIWYRASMCEQTQNMLVVSSMLLLIGFCDRMMVSYIMILRR